LAIRLGVDGLWFIERVCGERTFWIHTGVRGASIRKLGKEWLRSQNGLSVA
jgi:hypothetical protein